MKAAVIAFAFLATAADTAPASGPATDRARIAALEQQWLTAIGRHDRQALEKILAPGFVDINANGQTRDREEAIAHASAPADTTQAIKQLKVRVDGDTAIATGVNEVHSTTKGWTAEVAFTDVFERVGGSWRAVSAQETLRKSGSG